MWTDCRVTFVYLARERERAGFDVRHVTRPARRLTSFEIVIGLFEFTDVGRQFLVEIFTRIQFFLDLIETLIKLFDSLVRTLAVLFVLCSFDEQLLLESVRLTVELFQLHFEFLFVVQRRLLVLVEVVLDAFETRPVFNVAFECVFERGRVLIICHLEEKQGQRRRSSEVA